MERTTEPYVTHFTISPDGGAQQNTEAPQPTEEIEPQALGRFSNLGASVL